MWLPQQLESARTQGCASFQDEDSIAAFNPQAKREPCLRALIEANANLEATDKDGSTALMMAAQDACRRSKGPSTPVCGASASVDHTWRLLPLLPFP